MKHKARYISKYYDGDFVYLEYEYKGQRYEVYENRAKGNEPLAWQHKLQQANIDKMIELENKRTNNEPFDPDKLFDLLGWDDL